MRLVSITPSNTEIVWALGIEHLLVGVDDHSDFPPEVVDKLPKVGPDLQVDMDLVESLKPDLVLASLSVPGMERNVQELEQRKLPYVVLNPLRLDDVWDNIRTVGRLTGYEDRATELIAELQDRLNRVQRFCSPSVADKPIRVFWEWWPRPLITPGKHSWINDVCRLVGAINIFEDLDVTSRPVEAADVIGRNPDAICMCWCGSLQPAMDPAKVCRRTGWQDLEAVRNNRIYALPEQLFGRPGPRLVEGIEMLAGILHGGMKRVE